MKLIDAFENAPLPRSTTYDQSTHRVRQSRCQTHA